MPPFFIGLVSGIISGMGIGGGTILIPALVIFLMVEQHTAQAVNLLFFIPTAVIALLVHIKNKNVDVRTVFVIVIWGIIGAVIGSWLATSMDSNFLKKLFGIFLLIMGIYEILNNKSI